MILARCIGQTAKSYCLEFSFSTDIKQIKTLLTETDEMKSIILLKREYPIFEYKDVSDILAKFKIDGMIPEQEEFYNLLLLLSYSKSVFAFFKRSEKEEFLNLKTHFSDIVFPNFIHDRLDSVFGKDAKIKDRASKELANIRTSLISNKQNISKKLNSILEVFHREAWLSDDLSATIVNGRTVLPIDSSHKRKIAGLIHDESASGKTSYIEPAEVLELNNKQRELELDEQREIRRILAELCADISPYSDTIAQIQELIVKLDFIRAKALLAIEMNAIMPSISEKGGIQIHQGVNPLLLMSFKKENKTVVPLNLELNEQKRIMLISGPNAGGKSVAMKTTLLLQYMLQCGLLIPCGGNSSFSIFNKFFVEMGDDQSIENDLSTYSSHLLNMKHIIKNADDNSLVFIDEFGSGTEPMQGGAIAEALLNELVKKQSFGVITTHYTNLKAFAAETEGLENGAMLINPDMSPSFNFQAGLPGNSYALEIANRIGLSNDIIEYAKQKTGNEHTKFDAILKKVLKDKRYYQRKRVAIRKQEKRFEDLNAEYEEKLLSIKKERQKIINDAQKQVDSVVKNLNAKIENTIREIKEAKAEKEKTKKLRNQLTKDLENLSLNNLEKKSTKKSKIEKDLQKLEKKSIEFVEVVENEIHIGSTVRMIGYDSVGRVCDMNEKNAVVQFGNIITSIDKSKLEKIKDSDIKKEKKATQTSSYQNISELRNSFKPYIDVRGKNTEEALAEITDFVDNAIVVGSSQLKILHGKGDGILRKFIREYLKTINQVQFFADEDIRFGGAGITVVQLK
ncbi:MAG: endonuclease MutS2 [Bacteroidales bacterium]|nr:endonuclease MutS2 [Bacteroidales bacterium]